MRLVQIGLVLGMAALSVGGARADAPLVVVELFTSQGCSSCPPADAFLTELAQQRADVLALAFHVTYWDQLGWKDPFALPEFTIRQQTYARLFGDDQVYTPEMVVDGARSFVGSRRAVGLDLISRAAASDRLDPVPLRLTRAADGLVVTVGEAAGEGAVLLVGFDAARQTPVGRGENGGRTLRESNIVRSLSTLGHWAGRDLTLRAAIPAGEQFAVLLQRADGRIVAAARVGPAGS